MHKLFLLFSLTFSMTLTSAGQSAKQNDFAKKVLKAFKAKDFDAYKSVAFNKRDLEELLADIQLHEKMPRRDDFKNPLTKFDEQADSAYRVEFARILKKGEQLGIDWKDVVFSGFVYKADKAVNSSKTSVSGHLNFSCEGKNYVLFGLEATELTSGLKLSSIRTVQKGGVKEYIDPDLMDDEDL
jgi:hypothetical protein